MCRKGYWRDNKINWPKFKNGGGICSNKYYIDESHVLHIIS